jgi:methyl-accepting chemotaxis protein
LATNGVVALLVLDDRGEPLSEFHRTDADDDSAALASFFRQHADKLSKGETLHEIHERDITLLHPVYRGEQHVGAVAMSISLSGALREAQQQLYQQSLIAAAVAAAIAGVLIFLLRSLVIAPLRRLTATMRDIAAGEGDLRQRLDFRRHDELGELADSIDQFIARLQQMIGRMLEAARNVNERVSAANFASHKTRDKLQSQENDLASIASAMTEMSASVAEVARSAIDTATATSNADSESQRGREVMQEVMNSIESLAGDVEQAASVIHRVERESESIGAILEVIRGITEQTNLLALNAAIEAARAGEQGRGFAVVADEVRTLASRTQASTVEIESTIAKLQTETSNAVRVMSQGQQQAKRSVEQSDNANHALVSIAATVSGMRVMCEQIASAAREQTNASEDITRNVDSISGRSREVVSYSDQSADVCGELSQLADELRAELAQFKV